MDISYSTSSPLASKADLVAIAVSGDPTKDALIKAIDKDLDGRLLSQCALESFKGKVGQTLVTQVGDAYPFGALALIGAGTDKKSHENDRHVGAYAAKVCKRLKQKSLAVVLPARSAAQIDRCGQMVAEGVVLGSYRFTKYKTDEKKILAPPESVAIHSDRSTSKKKGKSSRGLKAAVARGVVVAQATAHARDMVNEPAEFMNPAQVAKIARALARKHKSVTTKVLSAKECEKLGMGMFLAVGRGSEREPQFIHMTYKPAKKAKKKQVFIGKGVMFDAGGYSLKPSASMLDMKIDMSGCAAVVSAMDAIATLGSPNEVHVITACCENLVSGRAYLLGDVLTAMDGTTVEINNTDAEGRLTLGDAITYAREKVNPDELYNFATLTGACMVALGNHTAGVFSNTPALGKAWMKAAEESGEDMWEMPLTKKLRSDLNSNIADMKNTGDRWGGAITAALFLEHFVKDSKWVHVDMAGPAHGNLEKGSFTRGATGFAVATIVERATAK